MTARPRPRGAPAPWRPPCASARTNWQPRASRRCARALGKRRAVESNDQADTEATAHAQEVAPRNRLASNPVEDVHRSGLQGFGGFVDRRANANVGGTAAHVARHRPIDVGISRLGDLVQERRGGHDLPRLAIAALRYIDAYPSRLDCLSRLAAKTFDR